MRKVFLTTLFCLLSIAFARAQTGSLSDDSPFGSSPVRDDPFSRSELQLPELGADFKLSEQPSILGDNVLDWTMKTSDYHLIDPDKLFEVFQANPQKVAAEFDEYLRQIESRAKLREYSMSETEHMLTLVNILKPNMVTRLATMLKYLNISIEQFNAYNENKRKKEFCRYRVALYRKSAIMYPEECWN